MLIYHPAYDAFHCLFRLLIITDIHLEIEIPKLRIIDFYFLFPAELRTVTLPKEQNEIKKMAKGMVNRYRGPINPGQVFREIEHIQLAAIAALAAADLIDKEQLVKGLVQRTSVPLGRDIRGKVDEILASLPQGVTYILNELTKFPLKGDGGLKHRTGLLEYRYDNA
jgi:hypothetical protein